MSSISDIDTSSTKSSTLSSTATFGVTKFNISLKIREIKQANRVLRRVLLMSRGEREDWISENGELVQSVFDNFLFDSSVVLDEMMADDHFQDLSQELMISLQKTMEIVESIMTDNQVLES